MSAIVALLTSVVMSAQVDKLVGQWKTVDDKTNEQKSLVEVYQDENGLYYGKIVEIFGPDKSAVGTLVIRDMKEEDGELKGGKVYDPENGKTYYGSVKYDAENNTLILRGSLDKRGLLGRSQTWVK